MTRLDVGSTAPDFTLTDDDGAEFSLAAHRGQKLVVFFYPAAMTPGCTKEACDFRDSLAPLQAAGYDVVGISPDAADKLTKFRERDALTYPLLSDPDHEVLLAYGAWGAKQNYGKTYEGVIRSTFVIDENGIIEHALYNVRATGHVARIVKLLGLS